MKRLLLPLMSLLLLCVLPSEAARKVWVLGDSTAALQDENGNKRGWAQMLQQFFNVDEVEIIDKAKSGASSKSFYKETAFWPTIRPQVGKGDIVIIQFAHNDEKCGGADGDELNEFFKTHPNQQPSDWDYSNKYRGTHPSRTFPDYIKAYIDEAKAAGATPIVVGAICRKYFSGTKISAAGQHNLWQKFDRLEGGVYTKDYTGMASDDGSMNYPLQAKKVADSYDDVPFVDLTSATKEMYENFGEKYCTDNIFCVTDASKGWTGDGTHPSPFGATLIARQFAQLVKDQYNSETDAKKKAVLKLLADGTNLTSEITFSPTTGDLGKAYVGQTLTKAISVSAFSIAEPTGTFTFTTTGGFLVSTDGKNYAESVTADYSGSTLIQTLYIKLDVASKGTISGTLKAACPSLSGEIDLKAEAISLEGGTAVKVFYDLSSNTDVTVTGPCNALPETYSNMYAKDYNTMNAKADWSGTAYEGQNPRVQRNCIEGNNWPAGEEDENTSRYIQFGMTAPADIQIAISKISFYAGGAGGNGMRFKAYYSTSPDFPTNEQNTTNFLWQTSMTSNKAYYVETVPVVTIADGETLYVRLYPYYSSAASSKTFCLKDMTIEGVATDLSAPQAEDVAFGLTREMNGTTFAEGTENVKNSSPAITVTNISTMDSPGKNQTMKHGSATPTYTVPDGWRNYFVAKGTGVKDSYVDGFYWGVKVSIPENYSLNISGLFSDVYGVKNVLTSKFVVKTDLNSESFLYDGGEFAANVENGLCTNNVDVTAEDALKELSGDVYILMPWYSGSGATYYALKDLTVTGTLTTASQSVKYNLATSVSPADAGTIVANPGGDQIKEGKTVTLTAKRNFGYKFQKWTLNGEDYSTEEKISFTMDGDKTFNAVFETIPVYTVKTFVKNDAELSLGSVTLSPDDNNGRYEEGTEVTVTAENSKILNFLKWEDNSTVNPRVITVNSDMNITAEYEVQDFIAVFDASKVQAYAYPTTANYPFPADLTWDAERNATALVVKMSDGSPVYTKDGGTPVVRNRIGVVTTGLNGLYQNGYKTTDIAWMYCFSTAKFTAATFVSQMCAKNNADKNYKAQYSLDGKNFMDIDGAVCQTTGAGKITDFVFGIPADAMGKEMVYIRITGTGEGIYGTYDVEGTFDGLEYYLHSESGVGNVYIMGTAEVEKDSEAPVVTSTIPADNATGISASGKITVSYNERVEAGNLVNGVASLNGKPLTPTWNTRSVSFDYVGLEYGKTYTFTMPAGYVVDKSGNNGDAVTLAFTVMERTKPVARIFDAIVDKALSLGYGESIPATETMPKQYRYIQDAINDAPASSAKPYLIYIKEGYYDDPNPYFNSSYGTRWTDASMTETERIGGNGKSLDGKVKYDDCRLVHVNKPNVHLIGQDVEKVIIASDRQDGGDKNNWQKPWYHVNAGATIEVQSGGDGFLMSGITVDNENWTKDRKAGPQALCLNTDADRIVFDGVKARSYQDTYKSNGTYKRAFWNNSTIEGSVDFIYGNGDVWFENTILDINREKGGWIVAPNHEKETRWGYVFNNTTITTHYASDPSTYSISFGRPWHEYPKTVFLHTTMELTPISGYWSETMGGLPALWAIYDIKDKNGNALHDDLADENGNKVYSDASIKDYWYTDGSGNKVTGESKNWLSPSDIAQYTVENVMAGDRTSNAQTGVWNPLFIVEKTETPKVNVNGNVLTWDADDFAICYVVTVNGKPSAFLTGTTFVGNEGDKATVQSVNEHGILSPMSTEVVLGASTDIENLESSDSRNRKDNGNLYNTAGQRVTESAKGILIKKGGKFVRK
ncbi:hypothetical protein HPS57_13885 [Prevotella sp. PINT]|jgi:Pectin methylesterase|uniref:pectinesterase family protein n=1 Tax=Palleniella intestinalis TaxID=2736291 RepID=UPI001552B00B|nr:pectinesterase family protein [Palleniella intestinalis]NPD83054.1 hypothetical protein [Palleniella intestinalis]